MQSIIHLYKIGLGPSSSHTMGPRQAALEFLDEAPGAAAYTVTLYGSLAATGRGHLTDRAILDVMQPEAPTDIVW
ncbi:MAG: serine dehydratase, partial [Muribaculaceae bacterium]|nr:serine dehydratase [Muribaculaceae bacterium]